MKASNVDLVREADSVIRAKAVEVVRDSRVLFKKLELISGTNVSEVLLPGAFVSDHDFNDQQAPYTFVRPSGRAGSCFAGLYRAGAEYLLFLKKNNHGELTVYWAPLAPVNEELHSSRDPWLIWVREQAQKLQKHLKK